VRPHAVSGQGWVGNSWAGLCCRQGGHGEGLRRSRGEAAGAQLGASLVDRSEV